ncbi:MAG: S8 family peptidase [Terracidiphilus sp.]|jgi:hypothetical protein
MPNNPVQVILNTHDYFVSPEPGRVGPSKDFFQDRDQEFADHRDRLLHQVQSIATTLQQSGFDSGVVKVNLRREAWAKSHRPNRALFPPEKRPCIGASSLGELYYHVTAEDMVEVSDEINTAESQTVRKTSGKTGKTYVAPSDQRSEVGAIETIEIPTASDKRKFSLEEAIHWLADPRTSGAYFVELFAPPPTFLPELVSDYIQRVTSSIVGLAEDRHLSLETFAVDVEGVRNRRPSVIVAARLSPSSQADVSEASSREQHSRLLSLLDGHPYVRRVSLPPIIEATRIQPSTTAPGSTSPPQRATNVNYPRVGIIDGGIGDHLASWSLGEHTIIAPSHLKRDHGSFIGGLLVGAQLLNGPSVCEEPDGCDLFDIGILPDPDQSATFKDYYPKGIVDFLLELENGVETAKRDHDIRIFNMSLNLLEPVQADGYGIVASLLDRIADKHDVLFVISAGNLRSGDFRPEWPADPNAAVQQLASRTTPDIILQPCESSRSIAVGALNAPRCAGRVEGAPTAYTRRGPGLRVGVKPDVAHCGGSLPDGRTSSGLQSWGATTQVISGQGTSYASPLIAKTLAMLESRVASPLTRETLIALLIQGCSLPPPLLDSLLTEIARQFVGFGVPKSSEALLETEDHAITLVFADTLHTRRELQFDFAWPRSLVNEATGACRGDVRMTLVYRPTLNREFGSEFVRINVDAHLRQEREAKYQGRVAQAFLPEINEDTPFEYELIRHGLKWWPIKAYHGSFPRGIGRSSNWRLCLESLIRSEEAFPAAGVPFALVLTISDIQRTAPVFNELRNHLAIRNVQLADIRTTTQVRVQR